MALLSYLWINLGAKIKFDPYSVDQYMYEIYSKELKKRANKRKRRNKRKKISKELKASVKFLSKKKKKEFFSKSELKDEFFDKLKVHLHLNINWTKLYFST